MNARLLTTTASLLLIVQAGPTRAGSGGTPEQASSRQQIANDIQVEERQEARRLETLVGYDSTSEMLTSPYDEATLMSLIDAMSSAPGLAKVRALHILALAIKQLEIPDAMLYHVLQPAVLEVEASYSRSSEELDVHLVTLARRVLWQIELRALTFEPQRLDFLSQAIESREEFYYPFEALAYIADIGNEAAMNVLDAKIAESRARRISSKVIAQIEVTRTMVRLRIRTRELGTDAQFKELSSAFFDAIATRSFSHRDLRIWLIQQLGELELEESKDFLRRVAFDPAIEVDDGIRYRAERAADPGQPESFYRIKFIE